MSEPQYSCSPKEEQVVDAAAVDLFSSAAKTEEEKALKALKASLLRSVLPACQPQEGSPANTFTDSELKELQAALPNQLNIIRPRNSKPAVDDDDKKKMDICGPWEAPPPPPSSEPPAISSNVASPQEAPLEEEQSVVAPLDWHGAPRFASSASCSASTSSLPRAFRESLCRQGQFTGPTNGQCPGFLQCNLVVLSKADAFDFLLFCQRNPKACPLIEVCDVGSPHPHGVAQGADLRTDLPKYAIYRHGKLEKEVLDVTEEWPQDSVAFLIGCSFSYDGALLDAGIPLRSAEQNKNVPMYKTNLKCRPAGALQGNMVVSMKPIPALDISKHVEITSKYKHAHGGPVCIGRPDCIGIDNLEQPDWGEAVNFGPADVPVFHACGVTPQAVLMESNVPFAITHAAGHMFITDLPSDMGQI